MNDYLEAEAAERAEMARRREEAAVAEQIARQKDRPKLVVAIIAGWIGVAIAFYGGQLTSSTTGQRIIWLGVWLLVQGVALFALWLFRAAARDSMRRHY